MVEYKDALIHAVSKLRDQRVRNKKIVYATKSIMTGGMARIFSL